MKLNRRIAMAALLASVTFAGPALAQTEIKLGHVGEPGSLMEAQSKAFAELANSRLGDKAKVVVYGSSQLGNDSDMLKKLKLGTIDISLPSTVMSSTVPAFGVFEMPYLVKDRDHMARIRDEIVYPEMAPLVDKAGYKLIGVWENGFRHITNNKRPIKTPEDLQGIKLRVPKGEWRVKMFQAYGANPSPMPFSEVFVALQTGVMDGQENPLAQIESARFPEVQKYLSMSGHVYSPVYVLTGRSWDRLDPEVRKVLEQAAKDTQPVALKLGAQADEELLAKIKQGGIEINEVDKDAFIKASGKIYDEFSSQVPNGKELIEKAQGLATKGS